MLACPGTATKIAATNTSDIHSEDLVLKESIATLKFYAYGIIAFVIIGLGIIGNLINLIVLTRPNLKGVTFVYLSWLATSDLLTLIVAVFSTLRLHGIQSRSYSSAFYYAHIEMPLVNALMASSVFLVVAVTIDRYWSVCLPTRYKDIHNDQQARFAITMSYLMAIVIYIPVAFQKYPAAILNPETNIVEYMPCDYVEVSENKIFKVYLLMKEVVVRVGPVLAVVVMNTAIIITFRKLLKKRKALLSGGRGGSHENSSSSKFAEERRLVILLAAIVIMFCVCMTPAAVLTVLISDSRETDFGFQVFRAIANDMEMANFAMNFYVYCLCSTEIRNTFLRIFRIRPAVPSPESTSIIMNNSKSTPTNTTKV